MHRQNLRVAPAVRYLGKSSALLRDQGPAKTLVEQSGRCVSLKHPQAKGAMAAVEKGAGHCPHEAKAGSLPLRLAKYIKLAHLAGKTAIVQLGGALLVAGPICNDLSLLVGDEGKSTTECARVSEHPLPPYRFACDGELRKHRIRQQPGVRLLP